MPLNIIQTLATEGKGAVPYFDQIAITVPVLGAVSLLKTYFAGATNTWQRDMHGRVVIMTGGTSGVGAEIARELAQKGAQLILLVREHTTYAAEFVDDLRAATGNELVYMETCDLNDLHSVRKFATKWLDNQPPRRLDTVICCAATATPPSVERKYSRDGIEEMLQVNYLSHYHLLTLLEPALKVQPPDRDVRIVLTSCVAHVMADLDFSDLQFTRRKYPTYSPWRAFGASKLLLNMFGYEYQRRLAAYERPDKAPCNVRVVMADPGMMRSPSFKRFITCGSVLLLLLYLVFWPFWWLILKTSKQGMQSILYGVFCGELPAPIEEAIYVQECDVRNHMARPEMNDKELQKEVFDKTKLMVEVIEKKSAIDRKKKEDKLKKEQEKKGKTGSKSAASDEKITPIEEDEEETTASTASTASAATSATESTGSKNKKRNRKRKT
ncbi:putative oxidoreductase C19A8.06 [Yarrowia sp. C11]|nr:putative oxidoreductase C19A8.06 [Yarrowia sp. E02]KAG5369407.1 putative oxidoreductase C19A8.06 [Yarrowia sp. C11]